MSDTIFKLIQKEEQRQRNGLELIPSENYVSKGVLKALGSILTDKYSEGYPGKRYYGGNEFIDQIEKETQRLANELFGTVYANVQPYSGSPANLAVDLALSETGDVILGMALTAGGHLTHGAAVSMTGKLFKSIQYGVGSDGKIDFGEVEKLAIEHKPKIIWVGGTAYPFILDFKKFAEIADSTGAYLVADISHIAGLVVAGQHPSPKQYVDVITTTTHKTLRGPRGAMILVTEKGVKKDPEIISKIEKTVFPGLQGGPHQNTIAAIAVSLQEAKTEDFKKYTQQVVKNTAVLAQELGTKSENHLILWDLSEYGFGLGYQMQIALEVAGITVNKQSLPICYAKGKNTHLYEKLSPYYPSGIRLGTPAITSRGMKEEDMKQIAAWIKQVLEQVKGHDLPKKQEERLPFMKEFKKLISENQKLKIIKKEIEEFASKFPLPGVD